MYLQLFGRRAENLVECKSDCLSADPIFACLGSPGAPTVPCISEKNHPYSFSRWHPSSSDKVATGLLSHIKKVRDIMFEPTLILGLLRLAKLLRVIPEVGRSGFLPCPIDLRLSREGGRNGERRAFHN